MKNAIVGSLVAATCLSGAYYSYSYTPTNPKVEVPSVVATVPTVNIPPSKPKAEVKPEKKSRKPVSNRPVKASRAKANTVARQPSSPRDFASDLRKLKNCSALNELRRNGRQAGSAYEIRLKDALVPWYIRNCLFTGS